MFCDWRFASRCLSSRWSQELNNPHNPLKTCIKVREAAVIFLHEHPSAVLLNRLSLPCYSTNTSWHTTTEIGLGNSITRNIILETRTTILHNCRRWTKWTAARCDPCKPHLMAAIEKLASKGWSVLHARIPRQLRTFYLKQNRKTVSESICSDFKDRNSWGPSSRLYILLAVHTSDLKRD